MIAQMPHIPSAKPCFHPCSPLSRGIDLRVQIFRRRGKFSHYAAPLNSWHSLSAS
ncbi:MAG: hypothetical protein HY543_12590 [Deltaproteobacteria bacterium]|nr:hypothetical protein [Deltaproteobacteria bacterium]